MIEKRTVTNMDKAGFILHLGAERLRFVGLDRLHLMRDRWEEKRHSNAEWELHLILQGTCRVDLEDRSCTLSSGQALLIAPGQYHRPWAQAGSFERFSLVFVPEGELGRQLLDCCPGSMLLTPELSMQNLAREILREQMSQYSFRQVCVEAMVTQFAVGLFRMLPLSDSTAMGNERADIGLTGIVDAFFEAHFAESAGEQALADRLHISRRQLVRVLQKHYGMSFRQKLIHTRMDYAAWLLRTTEQSVGQIGAAVGYASEAAFFKTFRQHFSQTPSQYRKQF